jgi:hypothetical protein
VPHLYVLGGVADIRLDAIYETADYIDLSGDDIPVNSLDLSPTCTMVGGSSDGVIDIIAVTLNLNTQSHGSMTTSTRRPAEQHHLSVEKGCQLATASDKFVNSYVGISHRTTTLQNHACRCQRAPLWSRTLTFLSLGPA